VQIREEKPMIDLIQFDQRRKQHEIDELKKAEKGKINVLNIYQKRQFLRIDKN
jgi:hypothetical protein